MVQWEISNNIHGRFVTCQRPIMFTAYTEDITVIYFRANMEIKNPSDDWVDTGVACKGYHKGDDFKTYHFNVAEYVRHNFDLSPSWIRTSICEPGVPIGFKPQFHKEYRFKIYPVVQLEDQTIEEQTDNCLFTREFGVVELNTKNNEITCAELNNKIPIDNFVNGTADGMDYDNTYGERDYLDARFTRAMTNMPGLRPAGGSDYQGTLNVLNSTDAWYNWIVSPWIFFTDKFQRIRYTLTNATTGAETLYELDTTFGCPNLDGDVGENDNELMWYNLNLFWIDFMITLANGDGDYVFNAAGDMIINKLKIQIQTRTSTELYRSGPSYTFKTTDKKNDGECRRTRFIFKNMRGGIDWFHCYGTEKKSLQLNSTTYRQNQSLGRGLKDYGMLAGEHSTTNLYTERVESFSVFSQPLSRDWVEWLEELIVSPQVWIELEQENTHGIIKYPRNKKLVPIVIDKGSYKVYSTEDNMQFIEFKYKLSDSTLTQIGY